jgi:mitotic spindle assembly checkpoint protein MAD2B
MPQPFTAQLGHFADFLLAYTHTLLCLRGLYPRTSFVRARFHNTPVFQSRHPQVCQWVRDAVSAVHAELLAGTVARIGIVIYWYSGDERSGDPKILERYMLDVSGFPVLDKEERNMPLEWDANSPLGSDSDDAEEQGEPAHDKGKPRAEDADREVDVDMSEQFRAALVMLNTRCSRLKPLPKDCSFNICMELKDEPDIDPPVGHPQPWIPVQSSLQKTGRKGAQTDGEGQGITTGEDLGGAKVTPIRSVEAGVLRFETWVEEAKAKFELNETSTSGSPSSGG